MDKNEKKRRKMLRDAVREGERAAFEASLPASADKLRELFDYVDEKLSQHDCDHTLRHSRAFAAAHALDEASLVAWMESHGGFCDCEVMYNVLEEFQRFET